MINDVIFKYGENMPISAFDDWGLILTDVENTLPEPKLITVDLKGTDGIVDLSESLTGDVRYNNRKLKLTFGMADVSNYNELMSIVANEIHGKTMNIVLTSDDEYYYTGRVTISKWQCSKQKGVVAIDVNANPYKHSTSETTTSFTISGATSKQIKCKSRGRVCPRIIVDGNITISNDKFSVILETGEHVAPDIVLKDTFDNTYNFDGNGKIKFVYRAEVL